MGSCGLVNSPVLSFDVSDTDSLYQIKPGPAEFAACVGDAASCLCVPVYRVVTMSH